MVLRSMSATRLHPRYEQLKHVAVLAEAIKISRRAEVWAAH